MPKPAPLPFPPSSRFDPIRDYSLINLRDWLDWLAFTIGLLQQPPGATIWVHEGDKVDCPRPAKQEPGFVFPPAVRASSSPRKGISKKGGGIQPGCMSTGAHALSPGPARLLFAFFEHPSPRIAKLRPVSNKLERWVTEQNLRNDGRGSKQGTINLSFHFFDVRCHPNLLEPTISPPNIAVGSRANHHSGNYAECRYPLPSSGMFGG